MSAEKLISSKIEINSDCALDEDSVGYKFFVALAGWCKCFPHVEFSQALLNHFLSEDGRVRVDEFRQAVLSGKARFEDFLKFDRFLKYGSELDHLCDLFNALPGVPQSNLKSPEQLTNVLRLGAIYFYNELKTRYPFLNEFKTVSPLKIQEQSFISLCNEISLYRAQVHNESIAIKYFSLCAETELELVEYLKRCQSINHDALLPIKYVFVDCLMVHAVPQYFLCIATPLADNLAGHDVGYVPFSIKKLIDYAGAVEIVECVEILSPIISALVELHCKGSFHGKLSLNNILFFNGKAALSDAMLHSHQQEEEVTECISMLPPERDCFLRADHDIYDFGKVVYSLVSGLSLEDYPKMPLAVMRQPLWKDINSFILKCCSSTKHDKGFSFDEFVSAWEAIRCRSF